MPTYVLEGGSSATLPAKPLTLRVQGPGQADIRLEARQNGAPDPSALSPMPGMLVLPRVTGPLEVRVIPMRERTFPSATVIALSAAIEMHRDQDPERAVMQGVDLSGLAERELLRIEPHGDRLRLIALGVVIDAPLPPLAAKARDAARELLGVERVPAADASALVIRVDGSASMRPLVLDGSVGAALEVLVGVSRVTAADLPVTAEAGSPDPREVAGESVGALPREVHEVLGSMPLTTGFRSAGRVRSGDRVTLCVVSDSVPADLPSEPQTALALIAARSARDVLAPRAPAGTGWIPVGEWGRESAYSILTDDPAALRQAVGGLLEAMVPADSELRARF
ncbi:hypothetical protein [Granulicoccus sp. GXG6511]|uniref:hypothetical protein n=1 Tax=Granulicoccus sp. GXG6511 TaxID=3381351 RepID=UPI003D7C4FDF